MDKDKCIFDYNNGKDIWDIVAETNETYKDVYRVVTGHVFWAKNLPQEEKEKICKLYLDGVSTVELGKMYGVNNKPIAKVLEEMGISRNRALSTRIYNVDEEFFDCIDTQDKAYIYGLLLSDGSNCPSKQTVHISLQEEDREILEKVRQQLHSEKPLEYIDYSNKHDFGYHYKNQYRLNVFSKHICDQLQSHGLVQNKSLILEFPTDIPDDLMMHMIRGMWDGDGSIGFYNNSVRVSLAATEMFCVGLSDFLSSKYGIESRMCDASCHNGVTRNFYITRMHDKIKFLNLMYKDANLYMERKYQKYIEIMNYYNERHPINNSLQD